MPKSSEPGRWSTQLAFYLAAAGAVAASFGRSRAWNVIGILGTVATLVIMSYYTVIAGWVLAYAWKCASGEITALAPRVVAGHFHAFLASPLRVGAWHLAFIAIVCAISARGVNRGIELANKIRAPRAAHYLCPVAIASVLVAALA
jgi:neurotransmitter:Na+ symporter, NSS family